MFWFTHANQLSLRYAAKHFASELPFDGTAVSLLRAKSLFELAVRPSIAPDALCSTNLRFCPICAEAGYHTPLFQFLPVALCPVHNVFLSERCISCSFELELTQYPRLFEVRGYGCPRCKKPWCGAWPRLQETDECAAIDTELMKSLSTVATRTLKLQRLCGTFTSLKVNVSALVPSRRPSRLVARLLRYCEDDSTDLEPKPSFLVYEPGTTARLIFVPNTSACCEQLDPWPAYRELLLDVARGLSEETLDHIRYYIHDDSMEWTLEIPRVAQDRTALSVVLWRMKVERVSTSRRLVSLDDDEKASRPNLLADNLDATNLRQSWLAGLYEMAERVHAARTHLVSPSHPEWIESAFLPYLERDDGRTYFARREIAPWLNGVNETAGLQDGNASIGSVSRTICELAKRDQLHQGEVRWLDVQCCQY